MNARAWRLFAWGALAWGATAQAAGTHRVDDSASTVEQPQPRMEWLQPRPGIAADAMSTQFWVNVRLDVRPWIGRQARIYLVLPPDETSPLELTWTTNGRLLAGRIVSGERALVFAGAIDSPTLQDRLSVQVKAKADWLGESRRLTTHFECEPN